MKLQLPVHDTYYVFKILCQPSSLIWIFLHIFLRCLMHHWIQHLCLHVFLQTQVVDASAKFQIVENTPDDPRKRKPDITKATTLLGWEPKVHTCPHLVEWNTREVCWTETWIIRMAGNLSFICFPMIINLIFSLNSVKLVGLNSSSKVNVYHLFVFWMRHNPRVVVRFCNHPKQISAMTSSFGEEIPLTVSNVFLLRWLWKRGSLWWQLTSKIDWKAGRLRRIVNHSLLRIQGVGMKETSFLCMTSILFPVCICLSWGFVAREINFVSGRGNVHSPCYIGVYLLCINSWTFLESSIIDSVTMELQFSSHSSVYWLSSP